MEIESLNDLICNLKNSMADTYCTIERTKTALQDYAKRVHTHAIDDITNLRNELSNKAGKDIATKTTNGLMSASDKTKLDGLINYTHPKYTSRTKGLYKISVNGTGHVDDVTAVNRNDIIGLGIPSQDTTYSAVSNTGSSPGLMTVADKKKLDAIAPSANNYTHPSYASQASGLYKVTIDGGHVKNVAAVNKNDIVGLGIPSQDTIYSHPSYTSRAKGLYKISVNGTGHVDDVTAVNRNDIIGLGIPSQDTTYSAVSNTGSSPGLMTVADKKKLDSLSDYQIFISTNKNLTPPTSSNLTVQSRNGSIFVMVKHNGTTVENEKVNILLNNTSYNATLNPEKNGYAEKTIELNPGDYMVVAQYRIDGWTVAEDIKTLKVTA